jgi:hypothetical protein
MTPRSTGRGPVSLDVRAHIPVLHSDCDRIKGDPSPS